jgi:hypothetical protein
LNAITPHLRSPGSAATDTDDESETSLGHERADEVVESVVDQITERLMESDHVDDIYAADNVIRRDAFRAIRDLLLGYIRGEIDVEEPQGGSSFEVPLADLGYVVAAVTRQLDGDMLREALERAAASVGGRVLDVVAEGGIASFDLPGGAEAGRLALEEAITEELVNLVDAELVELPSIEQVLELSSGNCKSAEFRAAIVRAGGRTRAAADCAARCTILDDHRILATLTPLSENAARQADETFARFLSVLEEELAAPAPSTKKPTSSRRKRRAENPEKEPPRSQPRNRKPPSATPSSTRARDSNKTKRAK